MRRICTFCGEEFEGEPPEQVCMDCVDDFILTKGLAEALVKEDDDDSSTS